MLALAYLGSRLRLVVASDDEVLLRGASGASRTLRANLSGPVVASLVPIRGGGLTAVAGQDGVWLTAGPSGSGATHELDGPSAAPRSLAAGPTAGGGALVAWTDGAPAEIVTAVRAAGPRHLAYVAPGGHSINGLSVAGGSVAWTESWFDALGAYHSRVYVLSGRGRPLALSGAGTLGDAVGLADGGHGAAVAAWRSCRSGSAACNVFTASRSHGRWTRARSLGALDPGQEPAVAMTDAGTALVGWIDRGRVLVSGRRLPSHDAGQLALAVGGHGRAAAVWVEGDASQSVRAALYR